MSFVMFVTVITCGIQLSRNKKPKLLWVQGESNIVQVKTESDRSCKVLELMPHFKKLGLC